MPLFDWANILGLMGVGLILLAYFLLQTNCINGKGLLYSLINLIGSVMILVSLFVHWNLASFVIEVFWILISSYGVIQAMIKKNKNKKLAP